MRLIERLRAIRFSAIRLMAKHVPLLLLVESLQRLRHLLRSGVRFAKRALLALALTCVYFILLAPYAVFRRRLDPGSDLSASRVSGWKPAGSSTANADNFRSML